MTLEEAKQLKAGDHVLIEAEIRNWEGREHSLDETDENVAIRTKNRNGKLINIWVYRGHIREKIEPPRRKFEAGDIVVHNKRIFFVESNEREDGVVCLTNGGRVDYKSHYTQLELVCPYSGRADLPEKKTPTQQTQITQ